MASSTPRAGVEADARFAGALKFMNEAGRSTARPMSDIVWLQGRCTAVSDHDHMFQETPGKVGTNSTSARVARDVCGTCVLKDECLAGALNRRDNWGVYGGVTRHVRERWATVWHQIRDERRKAAQKG